MYVVIPEMWKITNHALSLETIERFTYWPSDIKTAAEEIAYRKINNPSQAVLTDSTKLNTIHVYVRKGNEVIIHGTDNPILSAN